MSLFIGALIGAAVILLISIAKSKGILVKWYEWVLVIIAIFSIILGIQHFIGSITMENEPTAGWMGLLIFELIGVAILVTIWQLNVRKSSKRL